MIRVEKNSPTQNLVEQLIATGILIRPELVANNPESFGEEGGFVALFEEDYPALTPTIEGAVFRRFGLPYVSIAYLAQPKDLSAIFLVFRSDARVLGGGLGVGFKDEVVSQGILDTLAPSAEVSQAANFWRKEGGRLVGHNTDGYGFARSLKEKFNSLKRKYPSQKAVILGGGGTAGAVALSLAEDGFKRVAVLNRTVEKAERIVKGINKKPGREVAQFGDNSTQSISEALEGAQVVINTTTIGAEGNFREYTPIGPTTSLEENRAVAEEVLEKAPRDIVVADVVLVEGDTVFLRMAKEKGLETLDGRGMVTRQGARRIYDTFRGFFDAKGVSEEDILSVMQEAAAKLLAS